MFALLAPGVSELRIHDGARSRVSYIQPGSVLIMLPCGGGQAMQGRDVEAAKRLAEEVGCFVGRPGCPPADASAVMASLIRALGPITGRGRPAKCGCFMRLAACCLTILAQLLLAPAIGLAQSVPGADWTRTTPEAAGWSADLMAEMHAYARRIGTASLLVIQHDRVVDSLGKIDRRLELHSVRKSLLSALIGIAVSERQIDLNATLAQLGIDDLPPVLTAEEKQATVRDLLESRSGVYHVALYETNGERRNRPPRGSHPHGTFWYYNNWDFNALGEIYERAAGQSIFTAFSIQIAQPIGMQDYRPADGRYVTGPESSIPAYPFRMSARDLARFGLLYLHGGRWGDRQIVPAPWVSESTTPRSLTNIDSGYAYLWWTGWDGRGVPVMGLPPGAFWADGAEGQFVVVDPADDLIVVHQTNGTRVRRREFGHLMWLIRRAAHAPDPGPDPGLRKR